MEYINSTGERTESASRKKEEKEKEQKKRDEDGDSQPFGQQAQSETNEEQN